MWLFIYVIIAGIILSLITIFIFYFNFQILYKIKTASNILSDKTFRMQLIFFRAVFVMSIFTLACLMLPMILLVFHAFHIINNVYITIIASALQPLQIPIGYFLMILLIKPYRNFVLKILCLRKETYV